VTQSAHIVRRGQVRNSMKKKAREARQKRLLSTLLGNFEQCSPDLLDKYYGWYNCN